MAAPPQDIKIVVIGGQFSGMAFVSTFLKKLGSPNKIPSNVSVTVIDSKEFMYFNFAALRNLCEFDNWNKKLFLPLSEIFGKYKGNDKLKFVQAKVKEITKNEVFLEDGE